MVQANGLAQIEVHTIARRQVACMAKDAGKLRRQQATEIINAAFESSGLELPPEDPAEAAGNGKD